MGGGNTCYEFLQAGLVDVLTTPFPSGVVVHSYRPQTS
jgi:hypothetical protein